MRTADGVRPVRVVLVHGAATTSAIWQPVAALLSNLGDLDLDVAIPDRSSSGDLDTEIADLIPLCAGAVVVGVSGGATLVCELAARGIPIAAGLAHEPAAGSLVPGLLAPVVEGLRTGGVPGFGRALYGPRWSIADAPSDLDAVTRDLAMFRRFEPRPVAPGAGPVLLTVGALSPPVRHQVASVLSALLPAPVRVLAGSGHAAHLEAPDELAVAARELVRSVAAAD